MSEMIGNDEMSSLLLLAQANYDAAKRTRRLGSWNPSSASAKGLAKDIQTLRNRSRDSIRNEWLAESTQLNLVADVTGTGITARLSKDIPKEKREKYTALWEKWIKECDADGILNFYGMQALGVMAWDSGGEFFFRIRPRRLEDGLSVPIQIQMLEPELVPLLDKEEEGKTIRQGIVFNQIGKRTGIVCYKKHPGDSDAGFNEITTIPIESIGHVFRPTRIGQLRGIPNGMSSLVRMKTVGDYDDAVLEKAKIQNLFVSVIKRPPAPIGTEGTDPFTGMPIQNHGDLPPMVSLEPGANIELAPGEEMSFSNPPATGVGYDDFMRQQMLGITSSRGVPMELATGDIREISDRTLRVIIQQYRRRIEQVQWTVFIPMFCQKIRDAWVDAAVMAGLIPVSDSDICKNVEWTPQAWSYIHPVQDVQSRVIEVENGFVSRDEIISSRGYDPLKVDAERAYSMRREEELGLRIPTKSEPTKEQIDKQNKTDKQKEEAARAEIDLLNAKAQSERMTAESEKIRADAFAQLQDIKTQSLKADSELSKAKLELANVEMAVMQAKLEHLKSDMALSQANAEHLMAIKDKESEAVLSEINLRIESAKKEAQIKANLLLDAESHAEELRNHAISVEKTRSEIAKLELEAAKFGLDELKNGV